MRWLFVLLGLLFANPQTVLAAVAFEKATAAEHLEEADAAVRGIVIRLTGTEADGIIETAVALEVAETYKGEAASPITFSMLGGRTETLEMRPSDMPTIQLGDEIVVFLKLNQGRLWLLDGSQGLYRIVRREGRIFTVRDLRGFRFLLQPHPPGFKKVVAGEVEERPLEALFDQNPPATFAKEFSRELVGSGRTTWWSAPQMPVRFRLNAGAYARFGLPDSAQLEAAARQTLRRWTDVPGSYLAFEYAGTSTARVAVLDGANVLGTAALSAVNPRIAGRGSWWAYRDTGLIAECDISINSDRTDLAQLAVIEQIWTHELGHCAGLGHSADPGAIMYDTAWNDRGAELASDDILGLQRVYPEPRRPVDDGLPEIYIYPATGQLPAGTITLEIQILNAAGRSKIRRIYLGANGIDYSGVLGQYWNAVGRIAPKGWIAQFPNIAFPQAGYYPFRITACATTDQDATICQTVVYTVR